MYDNVLNISLYFQVLSLKQLNKSITMKLLITHKFRKAPIFQGAFASGQGSIFWSFLMLHQKCMQYLFREHSDSNLYGNLVKS